MFKIENFSSTLKIETIISCELFVAFHLNSPHYIEVDYIEFSIVTVLRTSNLKSSLFWDCTQRRLVVSDVSGQPVHPIFKVKQSKESHNYQSTLRKILEERRWHSHRGRILKPRNLKCHIFRAGP